MKFSFSALLGYPLGWIMWAIYKVIPSYGVALIIFTLITKFAMVPLMIKQQKSMAKQTAFQPRLAELQNKYKNNKEKLNEEMMKLYQEEGYSPLSGCLPMLIQFPILFGLINVIYNPLTHIMRMSNDLIYAGFDIVQKLKEAGTLTAMGIHENVYSPQMTLISAIQKLPDQFVSLDAEIVQRVQAFNFNFLGIDLSAVPQIAFNALLIIPILSGVTSILLSWASMRQTKQTMGDNAAGSGMTKGMMLFTPVMSLVIAFQVPAGVGMYWIFTNIFSCVQMLVLNKYYNPKEMAEKAKAEAEARREEQRAQKIEAKKKLKESGNGQDEEVLKQALSQKEINRRKLAEARRRDAEKYGEEYVEVTDEDLK